MRNNHVPRIVRPNIRILFVQLVILAICALAVVLLVINFPFPSPLVKPFLPPKVRWPTAQIEILGRTGTIRWRLSRVFRPRSRSHDPLRRQPRLTFRWRS